MAKGVDLIMRKNRHLTLFLSRRHPLFAVKDNFVLPLRTISAALLLVK